MMEPRVLMPIRLRMILERHKKWVKSYGTKGKRADLAGVNLSQANLAGANLAGANLARANLTKADLTRAFIFFTNLTGANLIGAKLTYANLFGANLAGADLSQADLAIAVIHQVIAEQTTLSGATFAGTSLLNTDLSTVLGLAFREQPSARSHMTPANCCGLGLLNARFDSRAVHVRAGGDMLHVATARKGKHCCVDTAESELGAMVALQKEIGEIRGE